MLRLTFNLGLALTGFRTTRPERLILLLFYNIQMMCRYNILTIRKTKTNLLNNTAKR